MIIQFKLISQKSRNFSAIEMDVLVDMVEQYYSLLNAALSGIVTHSRKVQVGIHFSISQGGFCNSIISIVPTILKA